MCGEATFFRGQGWDLPVKKFNPSAPLDVVFADSAAVLGGEGIAEGAVDAGGPQREFLTLCMQAIEQGPCFTGESNILTRDATGPCDRNFVSQGRTFFNQMIQINKWLVEDV